MHSQIGRFFGQQISVYFVQLLWLIWWAKKQKERPIKPNSNDKINKFCAILFPLRSPMAVCATRIKIKFDKSFVWRLYEMSSFIYTSFVCLLCVFFHTILKFSQRLAKFHTMNGDDSFYRCHMHDVDCELCLYATSFSVCPSTCPYYTHTRNSALAIHV